MSKKVVITDVNVELKVPSVSKALSSKIIGCFIEYISYIRNQIPFNFQIFNLLIQKKLYKLNEDNDDNDWHKFKVQRQLELATETINSINKIKEVTFHIFKISSSLSIISIICFRTYLC